MEIRYNLPVLAAPSSADKEEAITAVDDDREDKHNSQERSSANPRREPSGATAGRRGVESKAQRQSPNDQSQSGSPPRPFQQALRALERLTAAAGKPHNGVLAAISSSSGVPGQSTCRTGAAGTEGGDIVGRWEEGGEASAAAISSGVERCRVGFDMIRLLTGTDGRDARGRPVGMSPGEDVEAAVLSGSRSQVCATTLVGYFFSGLVAES